MTLSSLWLCSMVIIFSLLQSPFLASPTSGSLPLITKARGDDSVGTLPVCRHTSETSGQITTSDCIGHAELTDLLGSRWLSCPTLASRKVVGPYSIQFHSCEFRGVGLPSCLMSDSHAVFGIPSCRWNTGSSSTIIHVLLGVVTVVNYLLLRYLYVRLHYKFPGTLALYRTNGLFSYTLAYKEKVSPHVRFVDDEIRELQGGTLNSVLSHRFTFSQLLVLVLLFISPSHSKVIPKQPASLSVTTHLGSFQVSEGSRFQVDDWEASVKTARYSLILAPGYNTTDCEASLSGDWHCTSVCYVDGAPCKGYGPAGIMKDSRREHDGIGFLDYHKVIDYCMQGTTGCFAANGCWRWSVAIGFRRDSLTQVHMVEDYIPLVDVEILKASGTSMPSFTLSGGKLPPRSCIIKDKKGSSWLCHDCSTSGHPELGHIGDVQVREDGKGIVAPRFSICTHDVIGGPQCSVSECSLSAAKGQCSLITSEASKSKVFMSHSSNFLSPQSGMTMTAHINMDSSNSLRSSVCGKASVSLWIVDNSDLPAIVSVAFEDKGPGVSTVWVDPCTYARSVVECNGLPSHYEATWPYSCYYGVNGISVHRETQEMVSTFKDQGLSWGGSQEAGFSIGGDFFQGLHLPSFLSVIGFNGVLIIAMVVLVLRR